VRAARQLLIAKGFGGIATGTSVRLFD